MLNSLVSCAFSGTVHDALLLPVVFSHRSLKALQARENSRQKKARGNPRAVLPTASTVCGTSTVNDLAGTTYAAGGQ